MNTNKSGKISRSQGYVVSPGYIVGGGTKGFNQELDDAVYKAAEILRNHFGLDVTIRFNSNRLSGGAWLVDSATDSIGSNSSVGLGAKLVNTKLRDMSPDELFRLPENDFERMIREPDAMVFTTAIDLKKTEHSVSPDSKYILMDSEYRDFNSLDEASGYLFSHVVGLKDLTTVKCPLDEQIQSASNRSAATLNPQTKTKNHLPEI